MYRYAHKNVRPFSAVCQNNYGRQVIFTRKRQITKNNIIEELNKALVIHEQNAIEIEYLDRYYRGDQPILYRQKVNRPEINNKIPVNLAYELVERKTADICAEPIQYVLRGTDDKKSEEITNLNVTMDSESKQEVDIDICRWRSICGTAYRFIGNDESNCEIDLEQFRKMRQEGALVVKSNNGTDNKADVDIMSSELNQTEGQVVFNDLFEKFLSIQGLANRQGNTGGDTQGAVELRNGHYDAELRTAINEPILKKSERMSLKIILNRLRINKGYTLMPSDIEIHINHNKLDNMLVKAEVLEILLRCGVHYKRAIKTIDMFSDPEQVALESKDRMESLYPDEVEDSNGDNNNITTADK